MKTKTIIITALFTCLFVLTKESSAQIKVHESGQITLQHNTTDWYYGVQIFPSGCTQFNSTESCLTIASPKHLNDKCWVVNYINMDLNPENQRYDYRFYVKGDGSVYKRGGWIMSDGSLQEDQQSINNPGNILNDITGISYMPADEIYEDSKEANRRLGVIAQEVEKVLPEAVTIDDQDLMYVDYEALTVILIEAYKEQKAEIELLRKTLEEHGLLEPKE